MKEEAYQMVNASSFFMKIEWRDGFGNFCMLSQFPAYYVIYYFKTIERIY